jgi:hypothetical protein
MNQTGPWVVALVPPQPSSPHSISVVLSCLQALGSLARYICSTLSPCFSGRFLQPLPWLWVWAWDLDLYPLLFWGGVIFGLIYYCLTSSNADIPCWACNPGSWLVWPVRWDTVGGVEGYTQGSTLNYSDCNCVATGMLWKEPPTGMVPPKLLSTNQLIPLQMHLMSLALKDPHVSRCLVCAVCNASSRLSFPSQVWD